MTNRWANALLLVISFVVSMVIVEIGLRLFAPQSMVGSIFEYAPRGYSVLKSEGTALFDVGGRKGIYHFTSPHLRGKGPPPKGAKRILVLGDSFTFGRGLTDEETYVSKLQAKIDATFGVNRIALLNAGVSASGTAEQLSFLEDFGDRIAADAVMLFVSIDDFRRAQRSPLYRLRSNDSLELERGTAPTSQLKKMVVGSKLYNLVIQNVHVAQLIRRAVISAVVPRPVAAESVDPKASVPADQQRLARALFERMKSWCAKRNIKLAVINNGWRSYDWLPQMLASQGIAAFDAAPQIQVHDLSSYSILGDGHPNPEGATLIAEVAWPFVRMFAETEMLAQKQVQ